MAESAPQLTPETLVGYTSVNSIAREGQKSNIRDKNRLDLTEEQKRQDDEIVWNFIGKPEQGGNEQITERQRIVRHSLPTMPHCGKRIPFLWVCVFPGPMVFLSAIPLLPQRVSVSFQAAVRKRPFPQDRRRATRSEGGPAACCRARAR